MRQVQTFLGLSGYFRKFILGYGAIARPLSNLLKLNTKFRFDEAERSAFEQLKIILSKQIAGVKFISDRRGNRTAYRRVYARLRSDSFTKR